MSWFSELLATFGNFVLSIISTLGYGGIIILMMLESMVFPIPSELVMPFAGFLIAQGKFSFLYVIICSSIGSIIGSIISYYIGLYGGISLINSYGKYLLIDHDDLKKTQAWFHKRGELTIFIARLVPVVRHLISLAAGIGEMKKKTFIIYTIIGATIWNSLLAYLGYVLGQHWDVIGRYTRELDIIILLLLLIGVVFYIYRHLQKRKKDKLKKKQE